MRPDPDLLQQWVIKDGVRPAQVGPKLGLSRAAGYSWLRRYEKVSGDGRCLTSCCQGSRGAPFRRT